MTCHHDGEATEYSQDTRARPDRLRLNGETLTESHCEQNKGEWVTKIPSVCLTESRFSVPAILEVSTRLICTTFLVVASDSSGPRLSRLLCYKNGVRE